MKYTEQDIYGFVSRHYEGLELNPDEFSNCLYAVKCIVLNGHVMKDVIEFLDTREHWWEYDEEEREEMKADVRKEFTQILSKMNMKLK